MALSERSDGEGGTVQDVAAGVGNPALLQRAGTLELKIDGKLETWDTEKVIAEAQKSVASSRKFQEASELLEKAKEDTELAGLVRSVMAGRGKDDQALRELGAHMGMDGVQIEESVQHMHNVTGETGMDDADSGDEENSDDIVSVLKRQQEEAKRSEPVTFDRLDPKLQRALGDVEEQRINRIISGALDNDEQLAYHLKTMDPGQKDQFRAMVERNIQGRLASTGSDFGDGTRVLNNVLPDIKADLKALGTPKPGHTPHFGIADSPSNTDAGSTPPQEPDHIPSTDSQFEQHIGECIAIGMAKAEQASKP